MRIQAITFLNKNPSAAFFFIALFSFGLAWAGPNRLEHEINEHIKSPIGINRVLVVCLPENSTFTSNEAELDYAPIDWEGYEERGIAIVEIGHKKIGVVNQRNKAQPISQMSDRVKIRDIAQCENRLEFILIGKDRTPKKRWDIFPSNDDLYSTIDAMPMRRFEMQQRVSEN